MLTIIITMAGEGRRFKEAGYDQPKYEIEVNGRTLFEWSMESLRGYYEFTKKCVFLVQKKDHAKSFIRKHCRDYQIPEVEVIELSEKTDGQATTCYLATKGLQDTDEVLVYNIDTYVEAYTLKYGDISGDGFLTCFQAEGDHWSFVKTGSDGLATEVREKKRISDHCSIGLYYFSSAKLYNETYLQYYNEEKNLERGEKYIAPLYNAMIRNGLSVKIQDIPSEKVHVLGTPEEVETFRRKGK